MFNEMKLARIGVIWLLMLGMAAWGMAAGRYEIFPYNQLRNTLDFIAYYRQRGANPFQAVNLQPLEDVCPECGSGGFTLHDPGFSDPGYLLLSRFSQSHGQTIVELVRLSDFQVLHTWVPDVAAFFAAWGPTSYGEYATADTFSARHPILLDDGSIVTHSGRSPLACFDRQGKLKWLWDAERGKVAHHSIEMNNQGNLLVTGDASVRRKDWEKYLPAGMQYAGNQFPRDGYFVVDPSNGHVIEEVLAGPLMAECEYGALLFGTYRLHDDLLHINDADEVTQDVGILKKGDLLISLRNISTVLVYRPATRQIVWLHTGPWFQQHDPQVLPDGRIAVFSNNSFPDWHSHYRKNSEVYVIDPATNQFETPFQKIMTDLDIYTETEGRSRILPSGDLVVEETMSSRIVRATPDKVIWEYRNCTREGYAGRINWSRYYLPEEIDLGWLR
ncbi:hypothetical protein GC197_10890 [bacterium]|nr:hypothetical protein [bacterium]